MKTCTKCGETKDETLFNWKVSGKRRSTHCKECHKSYRKAHYHANKDKYITKARAWDEANGGKLFIKYKLTSEKHEEMLLSRGGLCWICNDREAKVVDHDHSCCNKPTTCGKCVRGLLCYPCNTGLGMLGDTIDSLTKAVLYLEAYSSNTLGVTEAQLSPKE